MAESFNLSEFVVPGTFVQVRAEGLISVGGISSGNVGIVGRAAQGSDQGTLRLADYRSAQELVGRYDAYAGGDGKDNLPRALEVLFANGARTVFARALAANAADGDFAGAFDELVKDDVNILIAPELATADAVTLLRGIVNAQETAGKDLLAVVGADATTVAAIRAQVVSDKRLVLAAPGLAGNETLVGADGKTTSSDVTLAGRYTAAAVAGLLSTLSPQSSPTNKGVPGVAKLSQRFSYNDTKELINDGVLVLEERLGVRVVRGITTEFAENGPFKQITTRRIVDFAKAGIRQASNPFIGRLNNQRVRKALQGAIDGFLTTMVIDEALIAYTLEVTATRQDEIAGRAIVNAVLQPTFSIDFIAVTLVLQ
jgi:Phage tail sheath C-terminal domain/Phage tail sheath protein subtilisin-like domain